MKQRMIMTGIVCAAAIMAHAGQGEIPPSLASLAEAERAFARTCVEKGIRDSFIAFFAEDGVAFQPQPVNVREAMSQKPATRPPVTLNWAPVYGDVAASGELGYTTGPYLLTDQSAQNRPAQHGVYFSVWKKQADGSWKVVVDAGIITPAAVAPLDASFIPARQGLARTDDKGETSGARIPGLIELDKEFSVAAAGGLAKAYLSVVTDDARLHRNGVAPIIGIEAIRTSLSEGPETGSWIPLKSDVSQAGDLGYTYGSYEWKAQSGKGTKGYYVRVWKRQENGSMKVVLDTSLSLPLEKK